MRAASHLLPLRSPLRAPLFLVLAALALTASWLLDGGAGPGVMLFGATVGVTSAGKAAERWSRRAAGASGDYADGVASTPRSWAAASTAAAASYKAGVTAAAGAGRYEKGIAKSGDAKWKRKTQAVGPGRYSEGVAAAQGDYGAAIGPVLDVIGRTDLPPRGPIGAMGNAQRMIVLSAALHALRTK